MRRRTGVPSGRSPLASSIQSKGRNGPPETTDDTPPWTPLTSVQPARRMRGAQSNQTSPLSRTRRQDREEGIRPPELPSPPRPPRPPGQTRPPTNATTPVRPWAGHRPYGSALTARTAPGRNPATAAAPQYRAGSGDARRSRSDGSTPWEPRRRARSHHRQERPTCHHIPRGPAHGWSRTPYAAHPRTVQGEPAGRERVNRTRAGSPGSG